MWYIYHSREEEVYHAGIEMTESTTSTTGGSSNPVSIVDQDHFPSHLDKDEAAFDQFLRSIQIGVVFSSLAIVMVGFLLAFLFAELV